MLFPEHDEAMANLITFAVVAFGPLYYLFLVEWTYQSNIQTLKDRLVLVAITIATNTLFFVYIVSEDAYSYVYYLLLFAIGGTYVDFLTKRYPSTGAMCHVVSVLMFCLIDGLQPQYLYPAIIIFILSMIGFFSTRRGQEASRLNKLATNSTKIVTDIIGGKWA